MGERQLGGDMHVDANVSVKVLSRLEGVYGGRDEGGMLKVVANAVAISSKRNSFVCSGCQTANGTGRWVV